MRVLVVEDDRRLAKNVGRGFVEAGFAVDTVHDGEEALAAALSSPYDAIVIDITLPKVNGIEVTRRLRQQKVRAPILMLTARDSVDDRVVGLEAGSDDYLVKPFAMRELVARVRALTRRGVPDRSASIKAGSIVLDTSAHTVRVGTKDVQVTAKEFSILEFFMHNPGRLLTKAQIIEHAWNLEFDGDDNLIEVYIGRLRRKLQEAGTGDPFRTVRGAGYRLDVE
jgi:two-component system OmpR family response regulator